MFKSFATLLIFILAIYVKRGCRNLVFKFSLEDGNHLINGVLFKVGLLDEKVTRHCKHVFGGDAADVLECVDDPSVDFVLELVEIDVVVELLAGVAIYIDYVAVSFEASLMLSAPLPIARGTSSGRRKTSARFSSVLSLIDDILAGLRARCMNSSGLDV